MFDNLRWTIDDFLPLIKGVQAPLVFVAHPSVPANNFAEFVTWAKANRGKLSYASYTPGTPSHFLGFLLNEKFDLDLTHVPYRGSGLQTNGLIAGHSLFGFAQVNTSAPQYAAGKLKALRHHQRRALAAYDGRADLRRAWPSGIHRAGLVRAPGEDGTPPDIVARLTDAAKAAHDDPEVRKKLEAQGYEVTGETGPQLLPDIKEQLARWDRIVKQRDFRPTTAAARNEQIVWRPAPAPLFGDASS